MFQTVYYLFCDGIRGEVCPHKEKPYRTSWQFSVLPPDVQKRLAEKDGWTFEPARCYCPVCSGNRKLYAQVDFNFMP